MAEIAGQPAIHTGEMEGKEAMEAVEITLREVMEVTGDMEEIRNEYENVEKDPVYFSANVFIALYMALLQKSGDDKLIVTFC